MKKIKYILVIFLMFLFIGGIKAESIGSIKMNIYVDQSGDAKVTEIWNAYPTEDTEYCHIYSNLGNSKISDISISDDIKEYDMITWNRNASLEEKAYKYGYVETNDGAQLCFGKSSYKKHKYTLDYTITNFLSLTRDEKVMLYFNLLDKMHPVPITVDISIFSDNGFDKNIFLHSYGNIGSKIKVDNGNITLSTNNLKSNDYIVVLAELPNSQFFPKYTLDKNFDEYNNMAKNGYKSYASENSNNFNYSKMIIQIIGAIIIVIILLILLKKIFANTKLGKLFNKSIAIQSINYRGTYKLEYGKTGYRVSNDVPIFKDLPCNGNIFKAYWVAVNYHIAKKDTNFLGALLLKWLREGNIEIKSYSADITKDVSIIFLADTLYSTNQFETNMYHYMKSASKDGFLDNKEFRNWCYEHYDIVVRWFRNIINFETNNFTNEGKIKKEIKITHGVKQETFYVDPSLMDEAKKLVGLKKYFEELIRTKDKEAIDVDLWDEYLMYAQLFGLAEELADDFREYPDIINDHQYISLVYIDYFTNKFIQTITDIYVSSTDNISHKNDFYDSRRDKKGT